MHVEEYVCDIYYYRKQLKQIGQAMAKYHAGNEPDTEIDELVEDFVAEFDANRGPIEEMNPTTIVGQSSAESVRAYLQSAIDTESHALLKQHTPDSVWESKTQSGVSDIQAFLEGLFENEYIRTTSLERTSEQTTKEKTAFQCPDCDELVTAEASYCGFCGVSLDVSDQTVEETTVSITDLVSRFDYCPACGGRVSSDHVFCLMCGASITEDHAQSTECVWCHEEITTTASFCRHCGRATDVEETSCPDCGEAIPKETNFCGECGSQIAAEMHTCLECGYEQRSELPICKRCECVIDENQCKDCPTCGNTLEESQDRCMNCYYDFRECITKSITAGELAMYMSDELDERLLNRISVIAEYEYCDFELPTSSKGGYMYVEDTDGERVRCSHPGEMFTVREVLGEDASEEVIDERTGFNSHCVCIDCLSQFDADLKNGERECDECGSSRVASEAELVGESCPACDDGVIMTHWTGMIV